MAVGSSPTRPQGFSSPRVVPGGVRLSLLCLVRCVLAPHQSLCGTLFPAFLTANEVCASGSHVPGSLTRRGWNRNRNETSQTLSGTCGILVQITPCVSVPSVSSHILARMLPDSGTMPQTTWELDPSLLCCRSLECNFTYTVGPIIALHPPQGDYAEGGAGADLRAKGAEGPASPRIPKVSFWAKP